MAHTYGEILERSFGKVWDVAAAGSDTLFVDIGSGRGLIVAAAVQQGGCGQGIGIEKYSGKYRESQELLLSLSQTVQPKIRFLQGDINDIDLAELLTGSACTELLAFCNNLAFNQGTNNRSRTSLVLCANVATLALTTHTYLPLAAATDSTGHQGLGTVQDGKTNAEGDGCAASHKVHSRGYYTSHSPERPAPWHSIVGHDMGASARVTRLFLAWHHGCSCWPCRMSSSGVRPLILLVRTVPHFLVAAMFCINHVVGMRLQRSPGADPHRAAPIVVQMCSLNSLDSQCSQ